MLRWWTGSRSSSRSMATYWRRRTWVRRRAASSARRSSPASSRSTACPPSARWPSSPTPGSGPCFAQLSRAAMCTSSMSARSSGRAHARGSRRRRRIRRAPLMAPSACVRASRRLVSGQLRGRRQRPAVSAEPLAPPSTCSAFRPPSQRTRSSRRLCTRCSRRPSRQWSPAFGTTPPSSCRVVASAPPTSRPSFGSVSMACHSPRLALRRCLRASSAAPSAEASHGMTLAWGRCCVIATAPLAGHSRRPTPMGSGARQHVPGERARAAGRWLMRTHSRGQPRRPNARPSSPRSARARLPRRRSSSTSRASHLRRLIPHSRRCGTTNFPTSSRSGSW
mmetsp:Transcript_119/g.377  ORF Transcript_119/g.377 Transcript_119/m.377 type:complete len:336 (-) Transcript_119:1597-2604(-)